MRAFRSLAIAALAILPTFARADDEKPKSVIYVSEAGKYSVTLPAKPVRKTQSTTSGAGKVEVNLVILDQMDKGFIASHTVYPKGTVTDDNLATTLDGVRDGNANGIKGKLLSEKKIKLGKTKLEGREVEISVGDTKNVYRARIFIKNDTLYQIVLIGPSDFTKSAAGTAYLDSFELDE